MKTQLVKFNNGKFGIRYGLFFYKYQDFKNTEFSWRRSDNFFYHCMTTEQNAREFLENIKITEEVVR